MATFFRSDGWVKSAVGPAVSGAQVYVCLQPANVTPPIPLPNQGPLPPFVPSPLADIFSDVNGLVPVVQPILTDGFGHYDFYTLPGFYTVIVALGGKIQQVYPDQGIGEASEGTPLVAGPGISIVGNVISATGGGVPLVLQTNGTLNGSQGLLNLYSSDATVVLTDNGSGSVNLQSAGTTFGVAGQGYFVGGNVFPLVGAIGTPSVQPPALSTVVVIQQTLEIGFTVRKVATYCTTGTGHAGDVLVVGLYTASGNLLLQASFDASTSSNPQVVTLGSAVNIPPGVYYFAYGVPGGGPVPSPQFLLLTLTLATQTLLNTAETIVGVASSSFVGTSLPPTLGVITPVNSAAQNIPATVFSV